MDRTEEIARIAHELNRLYCESIGDWSQELWMDASEWQRDSVMAGVRAIGEGRVIGPEQSHESWLAQKIAEGWTYGPVKDVEAKRHPCIAAFSELPREQQMKDRLFFNVVSTLLGLS